MVKISDRLDIEQVSETARLRTILFMDGHYLLLTIIHAYVNRK